MRNGRIVAYGRFSSASGGKILGYAPTYRIHSHEKFRGRRRRRSNCFLKYLEKAPAFENEEHEKAWLIKVCINTCRNSLKSFWSRKTTGLNENLYGFSTEEYEVMDAVMRLPVKYRSVILLFYFEDYSIAQIAVILHQKESTIGSQLYRARQLLKPMLKEGLDDERDGY
jgi:RNA polymerase sigma-70 factor (ECF subfamily)